MVPARMPPTSPLGRESPLAGEVLGFFPAPDWKRGSPLGNWAGALPPAGVPGAEPGRGASLFFFVREEHPANPRPIQARTITQAATRTFGPNPAKGAFPSLPAL